MGLFNYRAPTDNQVSRIHKVRGAFEDCEAVILRHVPASPERTLALRRLQEASFWANFAITHEGEPPPY